MTFLTIHELGNDEAEFEQTITVEKNILINAIRPYIYKHRRPLGTFKVSIWKGARELAFGELTSAEMEDQDPRLGANDFAHGHMRFDLNRFVNLRKGEYIIKMSSTGYSFSEADYFGWVKAHEDIRYSINGIPQNAFENPYTVELWRNEDAKNT